MADYLPIIATFACNITPLVLSDTSTYAHAAFAVVAPGVRFNAFAIFVAPAFACLFHRMPTNGSRKTGDLAVYYATFARAIARIHFCQAVAKFGLRGFDARKRGRHETATRS